MTNAPTIVMTFFRLHVRAAGVSTEIAMLDVSLSRA